MTSIRPARVSIKKFSKEITAELRSMDQKFEKRAFEQFIDNIQIILGNKPGDISQARLFVSLNQFVKISEDIGNQLFLFLQDDLSEMQNKQVIALVLINNDLKASDLFFKELMHNWDKNQPLNYLCNAYILRQQIENIEDSLIEGLKSAKDKSYFLALLNGIGHSSDKKLFEILNSVRFINAIPNENLMKWYKDIEILSLIKPKERLEMTKLWERISIGGAPIA